MLNQWDSREPTLPDQWVGCPFRNYQFITGTQAQNISAGSKKHFSTLSVEHFSCLPQWGNSKFWNIFLKSEIQTKIGEEVKSKPVCIFQTNKPELKHFLHQIFHLD